MRGAIQAAKAYDPVGEVQIKRNGTTKVGRSGDIGTVSTELNH